MVGRLLLPLLLLSATKAAETAVPSALVRLYEPGQAQVKDAVRSVAIADDGSLVVGSNELSVFNGYEWHKLDIPGAYGFRALALGRPHRVGNIWVRSERVWVGAIDHIGYLERNSTGDWQYTAMGTSPGTLGLPAAPLGDISSVHAIGDDASLGDEADSGLGTGAVWVGTNKLIRWNGSQFESWTLPAPSPLAGFSIGNSALVYEEGVGLLRIGLRGAPECIVPESDLPSKPVTWFVAAPDDSGGIVGLRDAAYAWDGAFGWTRLEPLSSELHGRLPTDAVRLDQKRIAIGTFNAGIVLAQTDGAVLGHITTREGLPENSVYAITAVHDRLFAGLLSGLAQIDGAGRADLFRRRAAFNGGSPRRVLVHEGRTLVLTTNGLYQSTTAGLRTLISHETPWWDATVVAGQLWVGGYGGAWRITPQGSIHELRLSTDVYRVSPTPAVPNALLLTEGYSLHLLQPTARGNWADLPIETEVSDTPVSLLETREGDVWLSTVAAGIGRFHWWDPAAGAVPRLVHGKWYRPGAGLPRGATKPLLVPFGKRLLAFTEQEILEFDERHGEFRPGPEMTDFIGVAATTADRRLAQYWIVQPKPLAQFGTYALLRVTPAANGTLLTDCIDAPGLDQIGTVTRIDRTTETDGTVLWLSGTRGLLRLNESTLALSVSLQWPQLATRSGEGAPGHVRADGTLQFDPAARRVHFSFVSADAALGEPVFYQTRLEGAESDWSAPSAQSEREFSNLAPGAYSFDARTVDRFGRPGPVVSETFVILTPWWRRPTAFVAYLLLIAAAVVLTVRWRIHRLERQNERLNQLVRQRTRELELSSTAKSEFLENISHEIRNPLNGLTGMLNLMQEERFAPRERDLARSLKATAATLTRVFEDVLEFSKLEYGYGKLRIAPFSLRTALGDLVAMYAPLAEKQNCTLAFEWPPNLADGFEGDAERIKTIVGNFIGNALKYAPAAPVEIRVSTTNEINGMVDLYIDVTDHGPGIPADEQELIFKKFVRGTNAKRGNVAGTGLGLATCHALARMMNGQVGVESTPGRGAMFFLRLLLKRAELPRVSRALTAGLPPAGAPVLVVDDEDYNRTVLEGIVLQLGFEPDVAGNAQEAAERIAVRDYAIIFLDWELPGPKGGALAQYVRQRPGGDRPLIIATTGHDSDDMRERCRASGMNGFLSKPFDAKSVRGMIQAAHQQRRDPDAFARPSLGGDPDPSGSSRPQADPPASTLDFSAFAQYNRVRPGEAGTAFVSALNEQHAALQSALAGQDLSQVAAVAHRLRALSGLVNASVLNHAAVELENLARAGSAAQCSRVALEVLDACVHLRTRVSAAQSPATITRAADA